MKIETSHPDVHSCGLGIASYARKFCLTPVEVMEVWHAGFVAVVEAHYSGAEPREWVDRAAVKGAEMWAAADRIALAKERAAASA